MGDIDIEGDRPLRLRPLRVTDEQLARQAHGELALEGFAFLLDVRAGEPWHTYLDRLDKLQRGVDVPAGWVPATFLIAEAEGQLVGRVSVRHELNAYLGEFGGHIGYAVRPAHRRRGFATDILRQALHRAQNAGVQRALVTCDLDNVGSAKVIEKCGGALEGVTPARDGSTANSATGSTAQPTGKPFLQTRDSRRPPASRTSLCWGR
jgi:predicted acetyltransferase